MSDLPPPSIPGPAPEGAGDRRGEDSAPKTGGEPTPAGSSREAALAYARTELGPACEAQLRKPAVLEAVAARIDAGTAVEDAVLAAAHAALRDDRRAADEFAAHFMLEMMKSGSSTIATSSGLRRFLDTGDLVDSVFGDIWDGLANLTFETRRQFRSLFLKRMDWKAKDKSRRINTQSRSEDKRVPMPDEQELAAHDEDTRQPLRTTIRREERDRLLLIMLRMKPRDAKLLSMHLGGASIEAIADRLDLTYEAARKALSRAIEHARRLAGG